LSFEKEKKELVCWAKLLYQRGFVTARSGNVSSKVDKDAILITAHDCYLGYSEEKDVVLTDLEGNILEGKDEFSTEQSLHMSIYNKFDDIKVVLHAHSPCTTAFFYYYSELDSFSFETKFYLGKIRAITQETPTVTNIEPVLEALEDSNIVVLKNHGVVSVGGDFKQAFSLIELLEEQAKVNLLTKGLKAPSLNKDTTQDKEGLAPKEEYKLLSPEHKEKLVELINNDKEVQELGKKYDMTCTLAVKNQDTNEAVCFYYEGGKIAKIDNSENAEFVITGKGEILKKVFNRKIDPFVASTQGKVKTKGDFAKMSKWYPVLVKTFKLWEQAPVE